MCLRGLRDSVVPQGVSQWPPPCFQRAPCNPKKCYRTPGGSPLQGRRVGQRRVKYPGVETIEAGCRATEHLWEGGRLGHDGRYST
jgi:hypothetical protein